MQKGEEYMKIRNLTLSESTSFGYSSNCFLLCSGDECAVIDPSIECEQILSAVSLSDCKVKYIILTHGHFDHMHSLADLKKATGAPVYIHKNDEKCLTDPAFSLYSYFGYPETVFDAADVLLEGGEVLPLGDDSISVIHTPGHTPGCICLLCGESMLTGDTLFADNIGRCDLWGGSYATIRQSLKRLRDYDGTLTILPGHGDSNTLSKALDNTMYI